MHYLQGVRRSRQRSGAGSSRDGKGRLRQWGMGSSEAGDIREALREVIIAVMPLSLKEHDGH